MPSQKESQDCKWLKFMQRSPTWVGYQSYKDMQFATLVDLENTCFDKTGHALVWGNSMISGLQCVRAEISRVLLGQKIRTNNAVSLSWLQEKIATWGERAPSESSDQDGSPREVIEEYRMWLQWLTGTDGLH